MRVLVIDDEQPVRDLIAMALTRDGYEVELAENTIKARQALQKTVPAIIIVDWMMPGESGITFCQQLKTEAAFKDIPVIMLTARVQEEDVLAGFEKGVDDYLKKPFSVHELRARVKALLKRSYGMNEEAQLHYGPFRVDFNLQQIYGDDEVLAFSSIEYKVLCEMLRRPGRVYSRALLIDRVWGMGRDIDERTVDATMRRIRKTLSRVLLDDWLETVWGSGYRIKVVVE